MRYLMAQNSDEVRCCILLSLQAVSISAAASPHSVFFIIVFFFLLICQVCLLTTTWDIFLLASGKVLRAKLANMCEQIMVLQVFLHLLACVAPCFPTCMTSFAYVEQIVVITVHRFDDGKGLFVLKVWWQSVIQYPFQCRISGTGVLVGWYWGVL